MADFDDLFTSQETAAPETSGQPFDKDAWAKKKQEQRETVYAMIDDAVKSVAGSGAKFQEYLDLQSVTVKQKWANYGKQKSPI